MIRFVCFLISFSLMLGVAGTLVDVTRDMMYSAADAHQHDQLSYAKFTRSLLGAKAKPRHERR